MSDARHKPLSLLRFVWRFRRRAFLLVWLEKASDEEPYWWLQDKGGNRERFLLSLAHVTSAEDGTEAHTLTAGAFRWTWAVRPC